MEQTLKRKRGQYRFFYHYYKRFKKMSVHWRGKCYVVNDIYCKVPCETKWNDKSQPNLVMQGWAEKFNIVGNVGIFE